MSPIDRIAEFYAKHPQEESFESYLNWHLENGCVFSTSDFFIMFRAIKTWPDEAITIHGINNFAIWDREDENCWYVHAMAGDISKVWDVMPYPLGYIAFDRIRDGTRELTILPTERIRRLSHEISRFTMA